MDLRNGVIMSGHVKVLTEKMLKNLKLEVKTSQVEQLTLYTIMLLDGLQRQRLTGEKTAEGIIEKQIYDSLYPLQVTAFTPESEILDLGSGGGLPGIPLKICKPEIIIYLMDSNKRKINFLKETVGKLGLERVYMLNGRAEDYGQNKYYRGKYDLVLSKAVAEAAVLAEIMLPLAKVGGRVLFYKGPRGEQEVAEAEKAIDVCGGKVDKVWFYKLPSGEDRILYQLIKIKSTPAKYPRRSGKPAGKPIN